MAGVPAHGDLLADRARRLLKQLGPQLRGEELVVQADVHQHVVELRKRAPALREQRARVVLRALTRRVFPEVRAECLVAPGHGGRRRDGRERAHGGVRVGVLEGDGERAQSAHGVSGNALERRHGKVRLDERGELLRDVGVHVVVLRPRLARGVHVEPGAGAEVPALVLAGDAGAARRGVGEHEHHALLRGRLERAALLHGVVVRAGQPAEVVHHGHGVQRRRGGDEHGEGHVCSCARRGVRVLAHFAAESAVRGLEIEHLGGVGRGRGVDGAKGRAAMQGRG